MLLIFSNQNSFSSTIRIFNMQKTSRINSDKSSIVDNQKERKLTTPNRRNNTDASRDASDTPRNASTARAAPRPTRSNTTSKHKQIRAEIRHHTYNTQRFSPLPISIPAKQISIICNPSSHRIQISVSPMQNPQKCSIARSKFYQTQKIAFCK